MTWGWVAALLVGTAALAHAGQVRLAWDVDPASTQHVFEVFRNTPSVNRYYAHVGSSSATTFVDRTARTGARYCYKVRGVNRAAYGPYSDRACGTAVATRRR